MVPLAHPSLRPKQHVDQLSHFCTGRCRRPITLQCAATFFVPGDLDLQTRPSEETRLPCEFGADPFSGFRNISYTNKKVTDTAKNRTLCSSLRAVKNNSSYFTHPEKLPMDRSAPNLAPL